MADQFRLRAAKQLTHIAHNVAFHVAGSLDQNGFSPASLGPWWSSEKAFAMRSSRMPARAEALGRLGDTSGVAVVD